MAQRIQISDVIPAELHGFTIEITVGPLKSQSTGERIPGRHAVYATLTPSTEANRKKLQRIGRAAIISMAEINTQVATALRASDQRVSEAVALDVLAAAAPLAKAVVDA